MFTWCLQQLWAKSLLFFWGFNCDAQCLSPNLHLEMVCRLFEVHDSSTQFCQAQVNNDETDLHFTGWGRIWEHHTLFYSPSCKQLFRPTPFLAILLSLHLAAVKETNNLCQQGCWLVGNCSHSRLVLIPSVRCMIIPTLAWIVKSSTTVMHDGHHARNAVWTQWQLFGATSSKSSGIGCLQKILM